jgi:hypothetical protein
MSAREPVVPLNVVEFIVVTVNVVKRASEEGDNT